MKSLTKIAVLCVAADLINKNGSTTTLEVKEKLQKTYWAKQIEVSAFMDELAKVDNEFAIVNDNGTYRTYASSTAPAAKHATSSTPVANTSAPTGATKSTTVAGATVTTKAGTAVQGDWEVNATTNVKSVLFFDSKYTRDQVRGAFAKMEGVSKNDTRARIIK